VPIVCVGLYRLTYGPIGRRSKRMEVWKEHRERGKKKEYRKERRKRKEKIEKNKKDGSRGCPLQ